jgi:ankyrin repeat protein
VAIFLIYKGADLTICDGNGCGVAHWAAYKNNVYLLRLFKRLGLDLNGKDNVGLTPMQRALSAESYDAIRFLAEENPFFIPNDTEVAKVESKSLKHFLGKKLEECGRAKPSLETKLE